MKKGIKKVLKIILIIAFILLVIFIGYRIYIVSIMDKILEGNRQYKNVNFYRKMTNINDGMQTTEVWKYNNMTKVLFQDGYIIFLNAETNERIAYNEELKSAQITINDLLGYEQTLSVLGNSGAISQYSQIENIEELNAFNKLWIKYVVSPVKFIKSEELDGKDCYVLYSIFGFKIYEISYIDKETFLTLKVEDRLNNWDTRYEYKFGDSITEEDIKKPDLSDYTVEVY